MTERYFRLQEVAEVAECSLADVENWLRRLPLKASKNKVGRGQRRLFSVIETMEISFISALAKCGIAPRKAQTIAAQWLALERKGLLPEFWLLPDGDLNRATKQAEEQLQGAFTPGFPPDPNGPVYAARAVVAIITCQRIKQRVTSYHDELRRRLEPGERRRPISFPEF